MVKREERRMRRILQLVLLGLAAPAGGVAVFDACSSSSSPSSPDASGVADDASDEVVGPGGFGSSDSGALVWCEAGTPPLVYSTGCADWYESTCGLPLPPAGRYDEAGAPTFFAGYCKDLCTSPARQGGLTACGVYNGPILDAARAPDAADSAPDPIFLPDAAPPGTLYFECQWCKGGGRRPQGYAIATAHGHKSAVGGYLASMAHLEAASVGAFRTIARELVAHGAPRELVDEARRSARDEERHARVMRAHARRYGAGVLPARSRRRPIRPLREAALDNMREGCVRETFGAAVACVQAQSAADPSLARAMKRIAEDETRHAALSWAMARWFDTQLDAEARADIVKERDAECRRLRLEIEGAPAEVVKIAGVPDGPRAVALFDQLQAMLWSS